MFTGIIESFGKVLGLEHKFQNIHFEIESDLTKELKIDQSVSHNGVCLTVVSIKENVYRVVAIKETIKKTNLNLIKVGDVLNLERALKLGDRLDGHIVQGHIDQIGTCTNITEEDGSWIYSFEYDQITKNITIEKGSITINGTSLTVIDSRRSSFSVAIIPYTYENTTFHLISKGGVVNLEFDILGKYFQKNMTSFLK
tara:strand:+ start:2523 stop:3116 length:594 start_codon:yes stop_codon:yes gene_type:complete